MAVPSRFLNLFLVQSPVIEPGLVEGHGKVLVPPLREVTQAEDNGSFPLGKGGEGFLVGFSVKLPVPVKADHAIGLVGHDEMNDPVDGFLGFRPGKVIGPAEAVAPGNPMSRHSFSNHDGIEKITRALNAHDPSTTLIEVFEHEPHLEAFGPQLERQIGALEVRIGPNLNHPLLELGLSMLFEREGTNRALQITIELPCGYRSEIDRIGNILFHHTLGQNLFADRIDQS